MKHYGRWWDRYAVSMHHLSPPECAGYNTPLVFSFNLAVSQK